jgi:hypothetical protein
LGRKDIDVQRNMRIGGEVRAGGRETF